MKNQFQNEQIRHNRHKNCDELTEKIFAVFYNWMQLKVLKREYFVVDVDNNTVSQLNSLNEEARPLCVICQPPTLEWRKWFASHNFRRNVGFDVFINKPAEPGDSYLSLVTESQQADSALGDSCSNTPPLEEQLESTSFSIQSRLLQVGKLSIARLTTCPNLFGLFDLQIEPRLQKMGIGRQALQLIANGLNKEVDRENELTLFAVAEPNAKGFYEKCGWSKLTSLEIWLSPSPPTVG